MLYMDRDSAPDEQEQFEAYQQVLLAAGDKPIIFRTMDIGGDKSIPYLNIPQEERPVAMNIRRRAANCAASRWQKSRIR